MQVDVRVSGGGCNFRGCSMASYSAFRAVLRQFSILEQDSNVVLNILEQ